MKNYLYTAREVIEFFDKKLHLKMSESNFTKHKKAKIFKIYKKEGKKGDFYKLPESVINYFDNVIQRSSKGLEAQDRLEAYLKEYKVKEELENKINEQWNLLLKIPRLELKIYDIKEEFETKEDIENFEALLRECNLLNGEKSIVFVKIIQELVGKHSNFNNSIFQLDMIEIMVSQLTSPSNIAEWENVKLLRGVEIEYFKPFYG